MKPNLKIRRLVPAMTEEEVLNLVKMHIDRADIDYIATGSEIGLKPDGQPLYILLKNVVPNNLCQSAYPVALRAADKSVIGGSRADAAGMRLELKTRKDGEKSNRRAVPRAPHLEGAMSGNLGSLANDTCRKTALTGQHWELFKAMLKFARLVDSVFRKYIPQRYAVQAEAASRIDQQFVIPGTAFTTMTVNKNFRTAVHRDKNDLKSGFGALSMLTAGKFKGGELAFPRYRVAVDFRMGDVLLADLHEPHANLPFVGVKGKFNRLSLVFYFYERLLKVCPRR
jgi:hypothetical protein